MHNKHPQFYLPIYHDVLKRKSGLTTEENDSPYPKK